MKTQKPYSVVYDGTSACVIPTSEYELKKATVDELEIVSQWDDIDAAQEHADDTNNEINGTNI